MSEARARRFRWSELLCPAFPRLSMKILLSFLVAALVFVYAHAAAPPRLLYLGKEGKPSSRHCAALMQELGRDAIWFDYTSDAGLVMREWLAKFDAVVLDAPAEDFKAIEAKDVERLVKPQF